MRGSLRECSLSRNRAYGQVVYRGSGVDKGRLTRWIWLCVWFVNSVLLLSEILYNFGI